jgi:general stress protein 26
MLYPKASPEIRQSAQDFLNKHPMAILSTVSPDGQPWGAAIYYYADEDFNFFFVTREQTLKYQNIINTPKVALTIADPDTQTTVQAAGTISQIPSKDIMDVVFKKLAAIKPRKDVNWIPPVIKVHEGDWMVLTMKPDTLQYADFMKMKNRVQDEYINIIIGK